ncbi:flagellar type III secretion system pore protein FliP [Rhodopila globiformis]|uniref:Flagellar biosynthetic protein FliP n=1 Tax=Rhodopila globiformis TaxID=1071 RepID=A0A2S6MZ08_RHOGL|nr:flagellar type III secretion system pore protein FliP [Rhodopila globiformis]PPQ27614.1 flagellar biosynthetic protein FliP [Rhodopila globiformis]
MSVEARRWRRAAVLGCILCLVARGAAAQSLSLNMGTGSQSLTTNLVSIIALTSVLAIAPGILVMGTAFTRIIIVLSMLRTALGLQQTPPNSVLIGLAVFLTGFIMAPAFQTAYQNGLQPLMDGSITEEQAFDRTVAPFRDFMQANTADKDINLFIDLAGWKPPPRQDGDAALADPAAGGKAAAGKPGAIARSIRSQLPLRVLAPAFLISELSKAFQIGFLLFLPFLVIDLAISAILMGMGMMMLPPVVVSLPFKLIFFVLVSGWELVAGSLVRSFVA